MLLPLSNTPRDYDWGSRTAIAELLGREASGGPEAELWFGAHPGSPSVVTLPDGTTTTLDRVIAAGGRTHAIGKIGDIFAHRGVTTLTKGANDMALLDATLAALDAAVDGDLIFANYVDFDTLYGHARDVSGYARALEAFDARLPEVLARLRQDDLMILTADHGNDPTWRGTDHTREHVPILAFGPGIDATKTLGRRATFADVGASVASHLGLQAPSSGESWW